MDTRSGPLVHRFPDGCCRESAILRGDHRLAAVLVGGVDPIVFEVVLDNACVMVAHGDGPFGRLPVLQRSSRLRSVPNLQTRRR